MGNEIMVGSYAIWGLYFVNFLVMALVVLYLSLYVSGLKKWVMLLFSLFVFQITVYGLPSPFGVLSYGSEVLYYQDYGKKGYGFMLIRKKEVGIPILLYVRLSGEERLSLREALGQRDSNGSMGKVVVGKKDGIERYGKRFIFLKREMKSMYRKGE